MKLQPLSSTQYPFIIGINIPHQSITVAANIKAINNPLKN